MRSSILASAAVLAVSAAAIGQVATAPVEDKLANNAANTADLPPPGNSGTTPETDPAAPNSVEGEGTDAAAGDPVPAEAKPPR